MVMKHLLCDGLTREFHGSLAVGDESLKISFFPITSLPEMNKFHQRFINGFLEYCLIKTFKPRPANTP